MTWRRNVRRQTSVSCQTTLTKTLFAANEILQGCLLHVRSLCEAASGSLTGKECEIVVKFDMILCRTQINP